MSVVVLQLHTHTHTHIHMSHVQVETLLPDVMHDLLEGTLQFEAKLILHHIIAKKYILYSKFAQVSSWTRVRVYGSG